MTITEIKKRISELLIIRDQHMREYLKNVDIFQENKYYQGERAHKAIRAVDFYRIESSALHQCCVELEKLRIKKEILILCPFLECYKEDCGKVCLLGK
jgi:hypothetical protein